MKIKQLSILVAAMAVAGAAMAEGHKSTAEKIKKLDTDGDGRVSEAEFTAKDGKTAADFARIDTDGDGYVTAAEMDAYKATRKDKEGDHAEHDAHAPAQNTIPMEDQSTTPPASTSSDPQ